MILTQEVTSWEGNQESSLKGGKGRAGLGNREYCRAEWWEMEMGKLAGVKSQKFWEGGQLLSGSGFREAVQLHWGGLRKPRKD